MKRCVIALLAFLPATPMAVTAQGSFPNLSKAVPYLTQRLRSTRTEVRYCLAIELAGRDDETKRALEILVQDEHEGVAGQAVVPYLSRFLNVERAVFRPGRFPLNFRFRVGGPKQPPNEAAREKCLTMLRMNQKRNPDRDGKQEPSPEPTPPRMDDPNIDEAITILGIIGKPEDAVALYPYLQDTNPYVAIAAARAVIRLGDRERGTETLCRLTELDPAKNLFYVTEALHALRELDHPRLKEMTLRVLASIDGGRPVQPNWVSGFILLAADVAGNDVWKGTKASNPGDSPK